MASFTWRNCRADIESYRHDRVIISYMNDVIRPALNALQSKLDTVRSEKPDAWPFIERDLEDMILDTKRAFALSIQSIWERQFREYLARCADELEPGLKKKIESANWKELQGFFGRLRNIKLDQFPSFALLDILQDLGNACRHGSGKSVEKLAAICPDLWPQTQIIQFPGIQSYLLPRVVSLMDIPIERLDQFTNAIAAFWDDVEYIYCESLEGKDSTLVARLEIQRSERKWLPLATDAIQ